LLPDGQRLRRMGVTVRGTARLEEGRQPLARKTVDIERAGATTVGEIAERAAASGIEIETRIDEGLEIAADPHAVATILRNLLDNAVKACAAGDGRSIVVTARRTAEGATLTVADDGIGFPPEEAVMIFEKFHRIGDKLRRTTPGTGLGLYIVTRLAEQSGASVRAESEGANRGATVTIT